MNRFRSLATTALVLAAIAPSPPPLAAQSAPTAEEIVAAAIAFHDPEGSWSSGAFRIEITGTRPLAGPTFTRIVIDNTAGRFHYERERFGQMIESTVTGDECWTRLNGSDELTEQQVQRFGLSCEAMRTTRDFHTFVYGLPMKLRDPGTRIESAPRRAEFEGRDVWEVKVTYDPAVGTDTWYLYFDPATFEMTGYRFYHDEAANDGEYVVLDRLTEGGGVRLPKVRSWFAHGSDDLVGTDTVRSIERIAGDGS